MNGSYAPEVTDLLRKITEDIARNIIKEGQPIILIDDYSWFREVLSLMAKQVNLCDSCILLLENGMEQEAYLLARSQFNNALWINYLCAAEAGDDTRFKEFFYQSDINQLRLNQNLKKMIRDYGDELDEEFKDEKLITQLNKRSREICKILKEANMGEKPKSVAELAKQDPILFGMYITLYNEGSKFEHSDISAVKLYRKQAVKDYSSDQAFVFDLGKSNKQIWFEVLRCTQMSLYVAFDSIYKRVKSGESQLFEATPYGKGAYSEDDFKEIYLEIAKCQSLFKPYEKQVKL